MPKNTNNNPSIETTNDGSHTLYSHQFNQHYHNAGGAISESRHIFFEANGLNDALKQDTEINILEIGFGTGLNLLLLTDKYFDAEATAKINYHAIEAFPVSAETIQALNYNHFLDHINVQSTLLPIFKTLTKGRNEFKLSGNISLSIHYGDFSNYEHADTSSDYIFHDAFSPKANPELWTSSVFEKLLRWSCPKALLTTYCAASNVRGAMVSAGWKVARAPGALQKREMTVASPTEEPLQKFKRVNERRLAKRFEDDEFS